MIEKILSSNETIPKKKQVTEALISNDTLEFRNTIYSNRQHLLARCQLNQIYQVTDR